MYTPESCRIVTFTPCAFEVHDPAAYRSGRSIAYLNDIPHCGGMTSSMRSRSHLTTLGLFEVKRPLPLKEKKRPLSGGAAFFLLSCVGHGVAFMLLFSKILHVPAVRDMISTGNYFVQNLSLHMNAAGLQEKAASDSPDYAPQTNDADFLSPASPSVSAPLQDDPFFSRPFLADGSESKLSKAPPAPTLKAAATDSESAGSKETAAQPDESASADGHLSVGPSNNEGRYFLNMSFPASDMLASTSPPSGSISPLFPCLPQLADMPAMLASSSSQEPGPAASLSIYQVLMEGGVLTLPSLNGPCSHPQSGAQSPVIAATNVPSQPSEEAAARWTVEHITLPKNGRFGVVVVGSSDSDEYSETQRIWGGRVAYTAYLHVGLAKTWILQYSPLRSADATSGGYEQRIEAPWPYEIFRPDLAYTKLDAEGLVLHGILNEYGRFESLAVASPAQFSRASFVLNALQQWHFRPARQNGKETAVEVVLILPNQLDRE